MTTADAPSFYKLQKRLNDSLLGYKECYEDVKDNQLKNLIQELIDKRQNLITEVKQLAQQYDQDTTDNSSIAGAGHRTFINLKSAITDGDKKTVIDEIERGENLLMETYEEVFKDTNTINDPKLKELFQRHLTEVSNNLTAVRNEYPK